MRPFALALLLATAGAVSAPVLAADTYADAVAFNGRPAEALKLDASRRPAEILKFMGLKPGMKALDVMTGGGYYAELMARVVGPKGHVTAFEHASFVDPDTKKQFDAMTAREPNLSFAVAPLADMSFPANSVDFTMIHLNYHDFYWQSEKYSFPRVEPDKLVAALYAATRPGGIVAIVDHVGPAGDTRATVEKLHRIDPATVKADFQRAGFVLDGESSLLAAASDDHTKGVFDPAVRGQTDRFALRFMKPR